MTINTALEQLLEAEEAKKEVKHPVHFIIFRSSFSYTQERPTNSLYRNRDSARDPLLRWVWRGWDSPLRRWDSHLSILKDHKQFAQSSEIYKIKFANYLKYDHIT